MQPQSDVNSDQFPGYSFLPPARLLIARLNELDYALRNNDSRTAEAIEAEIVQMAKPGLYEGYPDDDLRPAICAVIGVERANAGANTHSFRVAYLVLDEGDPDKIRHMDLIDFLSPVWRTRGTLECVHCGPKFWQ